MNEMQIFNYGENEVRTLVIEGDPWWVLRDVCAVLGIENSRNASRRLDDDEKGVHLVDTLRGAQKMTVVNESGLYSVILRSDKPEAKAFKRWITHEVLPAIRKTGRYENPAATIEPQPSVETNLQRAGLILRAAEHKAVPQSEQLRLLDMAIRDLTGTGLNLSPTACATASSQSLMDLPETVGILKKGKVVRGPGCRIEYLTLAEMADRVGTTSAQLDIFATLHEMKTSAYGEWVRVDTPSGEAREFLYASTTAALIRKEANEND